MLQYAYIVVVGPAKHGKSTVADEIRKVTGRSVAETGDFLVDLRARIERKRDGVGFAYSHAEWVEYIKRTKNRYRGQLRMDGDVLVEYEPDSLIKGALRYHSSATIVVGVRRWAEINAFLSPLKLSSVLFIEVFRPGAPVEQDSYELSGIRSAMPCITIFNDGDEAKLRAAVRTVVDRETKKE